MAFAGIVSLIFVGAFALGMLALLGVGLKNVWRGCVSPRWPSTDAEVAKVEMTISTTRDSRRQTGSTTYHAELTFRYFVNAKEHTTDQVRWGQTLGSGDPAEAVVLALSYPEGRRVAVHYNPDRPEEAVVKPGLTGAAFLLPGAALAFLMFLVPGCFMIWRMTMLPETGRPSPMPDMGPFIRIFLGIPILMGLAMLVVGGRNLMRASQSTAWPTVPGMWLSDVPTNQVPAIDLLREHRGFDYVYRYEAGGGSRYQCVRWFGQGTASGNDSDAEIETEFPRGQPLTVHYDPKDPETAVLRPGVTNFAWILPSAGVGFMLFGVLGILAMARRS